MFVQAIIGIVLTIVAILVVIVSVTIVSEQLRSYRRGYLVKGSAAKSIIRYIEKDRNTKRSLILPGELIGYGHTVYQRLSNEE